MKKIFCLTGLSVIVSLMSCTDSADKTTASTSTGTDSTATSQAETNKANNRKVLKAIETGDSSVINSLIADDAVDHQGPHGDMKGDSIKHMLTDMHNHIKDLKIDVIADAADGDYIFAMSEMSGTTTDAWMGMPAGMKMDDKGVDVVKVKDGKMVEHWGFVDANDMMKHMKDMPMDKMGSKMDTTKMKK
jgi:predicted ester cyclase